jgi:protein TonB
MLIAMFAAALAQADPASTAARTAPITIPRSSGWASMPSRRDLGRAVPKEALRLGLSGRVVLRCDVLDNGKLAGCIVQSEDPAGVGFGEAAYRLIPKFQLAPLPGGQSLAGGVITIPIGFESR